MADRYEGRLDTFLATAAPTLWHTRCVHQVAANLEQATMVVSAHHMPVQPEQIRSHRCGRLLH